MINKIRKIIEENDSIILVSHFNPDGDAFGSQMGLRQSLRLTYPEKKIYATGTGIKNFFSLIGKVDVVDDEIFEKSLIILLDANELYRFEDQRSLRGKDFILIDHHIQTAKFTFDTLYVDEDASSTCELVLRFIKELDLKIDEVVANSLLLGLTTDTGRFQYAENHQEVFSIAKFLTSKGASLRKIIQRLNHKNDKDLKLRQFIYNNIETDGNVIYVCFKNELLKELGVSSSYALSLVNLIENVKGHPIWMMYAYEQDGSAHFEIRSSDFIVQPIARKFGGGGHANACGVTIYECNREKAQIIIDELNNLVEGN